jgi:hypothetical protein
MESIGSQSKRTSSEIYKGIEREFQVSSLIAPHRT